MHLIFRIFCSLSIFAASVCFADDRANPNELFSQANQAFEAANYPQAISLYNQLVENQKSSANLYLNLGTAHFRNGSPGQAALWFRRADHLRPGMPEVRYNLEYLQRHLGSHSFSGEVSQKLLLRVSPKLLSWAAWGFGWLALFSLLAVLFWRRRSLKPLLVVVMIFTATISAFLFWSKNYRFEKLAPHNFATVTDSLSKAMVAPIPDSEPVIDLPEGSEVKIVENTGPWLYVAIPGDFIGWVHHSAVEPNWPLPELEPQN